MKEKFKLNRTPNKWVITCLIIKLSQLKESLGSNSQNKTLSKKLKYLNTIHLEQLKSI